MGRHSSFYLDPRTANSLTILAVALGEARYDHERMVCQPSSKP